MNPCLGDFLAVRFNHQSIDAEQLAKAMSWPKLGDQQIPVKARNLGNQLKVAWHGDVAAKDLGNDFQLEISLIAGDGSIDEFIAGKSESLFGKFARVTLNKGSEKITAFSDAMRQIPLYWLSTDKVQAVATDIRLLAQLPGVQLNISDEAIYHYLNFAYVPTPYTIYENIRKIEPGSKLELDKGKIDWSRYWQPVYDESLSGSEEQLIEKLTSEVEHTVSQYALPSDNWGSFLSGGTDSSTITGILSRTAGKERTHSYSIGFVEEGYDELEYAKAAADAFGINHHAVRVSAEDTLGAIQTMVEAYDEPFGNSSAVPTFHCTQLANGNQHKIMVGGDGGDEIFGGNERYAKDIYFQKYYGLPGFVKGLGNVVRTGLGPVDLRLVNRVKNFLYRGSLPNPERFYTDDSFASEFYSELLTPDFREHLSQRSSLEILEHHFNACDAKSELNKLMYIDLQMAIADNDLTKVNRAAKASGVSVLYPFLSPSLIQFMGRIPVQWKVKGTDKRYLFKQAVKHILPETIIKKKKQGFGLPVGEWLKSDPQFKSLLGDTLLSSTFNQRGYFNRGFIENLIDRHQKGAWDYTQELWSLLMLEMWHQKHSVQPSVKNDAA